MKHLIAVKKYLWKYRLRLGAGFVFVVLSNYFALLAPQVTAYVVNKVQAILPGALGKAPQLMQTDILVNAFIHWVEQSSFSFSALVALCGITILVLAILRGVFMFFMRQTLIVMSRYIEYDQKNDVFAHYLTMDADFFKRHATGDLMSRIAEDVGRVRMFTGPAIMYLINLVTVIALACYNMFAKNVSLTLYCLAPLPLLAFIIYFVNTIIHKKSEQIQSQLGTLTSQAQQAYSGIRVIKSFVQEDAVQHAFEKQSATYRSRALSLARVEAMYFPSIGMLIGLSTLITIMMGGFYVLNGRVTDVGTIVEFVLYINMLTFPVSAIGWVASMVQRAAASQKRLNEMLEQRPQVVSPAFPLQASESSETALEFQQVSFTYPHTGVRALQDISFEVRKGETVAIVGQTGSGKSTVAALLLRFFDPQEGAVRVNGVEVRKLDLADLRSRISVVPQESFLFSDTVLNNIRFHEPEVDESTVRHAAMQAAVAADIEQFPLGYDTLVGERGVTLSGGQKQRTAIARALLKPADILVLDDCLSAVDVRTEKTVLQQLAQHLKGKTAIIITHRIFSLLQFDKIIVLHQGTVAESGTHQQLLEKNGLYADMYNRQQMEGTEDAGDSL